LLRPGTLAILDNIVTLFGKVLGLCVFAWGLGAAAQGEFSLFLAIQGMATVLALAGLEVANNFFSAKTASRLLFRALLGNSLIAGLALGSIGGLVLIAIDFLGGTLDRLSIGLRWLLLADTVIGVIAFALSGLLFGRNRVEMRLLGSIVHNTTFIAGLLVLLATNRLDVFSGLLVWSVGLAACLVCWGWSAWRLAGGMALHKGLFRLQLGYGMTSYPYFALSALNMRLNAVFIEQFLGISASILSRRPQQKSFSIFQSRS
jgi:O-antigen/teichoic acid export membrane protein